jgi:hypothetical protein
MTPMQIFDGSSTEREIAGKQHRAAERRLADLAHAVRQHEDTTRGQLTSAARPQDGRLYRRLREVCGQQSGQ